MNKLFISLLFIIAFMLRIALITYSPPSLNWDEVSLGYNAYSLSTSGVDEWGEAYPTIFRAYGDYKLPVYIYFLIPFVAVFGLNIVSVRLPSLLAGSILPVCIYLLTKRLYDEKIARVAGLLAVITPWTFFLSRVALEANLSLTFIVAGIYFFVRQFDKKESNSLILSAIFFSLSVWTYNSSRIFTPLIIITLIAFYNKKLIFLRQKRLLLFTSFVLVLFFIGSMFVQLLSEEGSARYNNVSIINEGAINYIIEQRQTSSLPSTMNRLVFNRPVYFLSTFTNNYFNHFSTGYLFSSGGDNYQFNIPETGLLYPLFMPLMIIGCIYGFIQKDKRRSTLFLLLWLLLAPIVSSITRESPHTLRNISAAPAYIIFSAFGMWMVYSVYFQRKRIVSIFFILICLTYFAQYSIKLFVDYPVKYSQAWQYGYKEAVEYAKNKYHKYDTIIITKKYGEPHEFVLFYFPWSSEDYRKDTNLTRFYQSNWYWVDSFDKFYFMNDWQIPNDESDFFLESKTKVPIDNKVLLITTPANYPKGWKHIDQIHFLDGSVAFDIVEK